MSIWRPTASLANLRLRAELLKKTRAFFEARKVLEVETPALSQAGATDRHLASFRVASTAAKQLYLHTSPEFPMKRLLAAGSGDIWQLCKVFRDGEAGRRHNPEFTLIEWYRLGFDLRRLMQEVAELIGELLPATPAATEYLSFREAFERHARLDSFTARERDCLRVLQESGRRVPAEGDLDYDGWLDLVAAELVYPQLGRQGLSFIYDYPASQAALARIRPENPPVAERFEIFFNGMELANGFHELADADEQRRRFDSDRDYRRARGSPDVPLDERLLSALQHGLPDCSGVALGFDRVVMLAAGAKSIEEVIAFSMERA
ncbi:MAG: EF-P lysine aminoacylase GenX [Gammaproteobacteria bacterium]|nr:EF-P lysine aminoacylase GenX [Gammaproteobacteria bacterium]MBU6509580.1 EF-P lysine aminoacylase GenX [Gammaproteobacteria bacterium]MDE1983437.1 EF-P lysine aminoacylase GenX [Gammaproteobacteria bacterium]MDE2109440.1 EF-P lysine aminoacylase GenX [Gammaproteobacteria bacterium]MDE2460391.1 EF-P lysine aminoacylase GenX [Gammaproteobacteria bacterium]